MEIGAGLRGKRVFVTGHTGFKGAWLTRWLNRMGARVVGYALPPRDPSLFDIGFNILGITVGFGAYQAWVAFRQRLQPVF